MEISRELSRRFGGFWNNVLLVLILIACFRFSGAEWKTAGLDVRFLRGLYLVLGVIGLGLAMAGVKLAILRLDSPSFWKNRATEVAVSGLKLGIWIGGVILFVTGVLLVDDFLGPFQGFIDAALEKLAEKF